MSRVITLDTRTVPGPVTGRGTYEALVPDWVDCARHTAHTLPEGMRLLDYEIVGPIGEGGFGIVYLAWDHALEQHVAVKEYLPAILASRASVSPDVIVKSQRHMDTFRVGMRSFINEARLLARFDHPSLVRVLHFWEGNGTAYMVMPYYEGPTLSHALSELGRPPEQAELSAWLRPLLDALGTMHAASCLHRDIAPDNILLTDHGPVLLDFGAARRVIDGMAQSPTVVFKPGYAPIEQYGEVASMKQGPWTDLYGLASVVYMAITGQPPTPSIERLMDDHLQPLSEIARGRYSAPFLAAVDAALALLPRDRPQSAAEFWARLSCSQPLEDLDLVRAVHGLGVRASAADEGPAETAPGDDAPEASAPPPLVEAAPEPTATPATTADAEPEAVEEDAPDVLVTPTAPPASAWPPLRPMPSPAQRRSSRRKTFAAAAVVLVIGLAAIGYRGIGDPPPAEPMPSPPLATTPAEHTPSPPLAAVPVEPTPAPPPAAAPVLPEPPPPAVASVPDTAEPAPNPIAALLPNPPPAPPVAADPLEPREPARKAAVRARAEPTRATRREARKPQATPPAEPRPAASEVVEVHDSTSKCAEILQRASLGPLTAGEAALLRKGCE